MGCHHHLHTTTHTNTGSHCTRTPSRCAYHTPLPRPAPPPTPAPACANCCVAGSTPHASPGSRGGGGGCTPRWRQHRCDWGHNNHPLRCRRRLGCADDPPRREQWVFGKPRAVPLVPVLAICAATLGFPHGWGGGGFADARRGRAAATSLGDAHRQRERVVLKGRGRDIGELIIAPEERGRGGIIDKGSMESRQSQQTKLSHCAQIPFVTAHYF